MPTRYITNLTIARISQLYNAFIADVSGNIYYAENNELVPKYSRSGIWYCDIHLSGYGKSTYKVGLLVALAFRDIQLHHTQLNQLDVLYRDNDPNNLNIDNLVIKYPQTGLPHPTMRNFRYIPGFSRYVINTEGVIYSLEKRVVKETLPHPDGYLYFNLVPDGGYDASVLKRRGRRGLGVGLHRLNALAFTDYPVNCWNLHVDHIDNNPANNDKSNVQWLTPSENTLKGVGFIADRQNKCYYVKDLVTGDIHKFPSQSQTAKFCGVVRNAICQGIDGSMVQGRYLISVTGTFPTLNEDGNKIEVTNQSNQGKPVLVKNIATGEVLEYPSASKFIIANELSKKKVTTLLKKGVHQNVGGFVFQYKADNPTWLL